MNLSNISDSISAIDSDLFLGDVTAATSKELLETFNITHILSLDVAPPDLHQDTVNLFIQVSRDQ